MAKLLGNNYRMWVESATPGTYNNIAGQQSLTMARTASTFDTSSKDDAPYASTAPGLFTSTITLTGVATLPDTTGFTFVEGKFKSQTAWKFQIRKGGSAGLTTDAVFEGLLYVTELSPDYSQNAAVKYTMKFELAAAPTIDALA